MSIKSIYGAQKKRDFCSTECQTAREAKTHIRSLVGRGGEEGERRWGGAVVENYLNNWKTMPHIYGNIIDLITTIACIQPYLPHCIVLL